MGYRQSEAKIWHDGERHGSRLCRAALPLQLLVFTRRIHPHELIARAAALGYCALAITDECSVSGVVRAYEAARDNPIKFIVAASSVGRWAQVSFARDEAVGLQQSQ